MNISLKDFLRLEVTPALGCTEPVAVALGAAAAASLLPREDISSIEVWTDPNIFKNGLGVLIPGTGGLQGLDVAAGLGALGGDPGKKMQVLADAASEVVAKAKKMASSGRITVNLSAEQTGLYIKCRVSTPQHTAEAVIQTFHERIVSLRLDGQPVEDSPLLDAPNRSRSSISVADVEAWLTQSSLADLLRRLPELDPEDLEFLERGVEMNLRLADYGLEHRAGLGVGRALDQLMHKGWLCSDPLLAARKLTAAAADARMSGAELPAMSSAGSGNNGLTAMLPVWAVQQWYAGDKRRFLEGLCLSHLVTGLIKAHIGRLSALCSCSIAAGAGASAGIVHLLGGRDKEIATAVINLIEDLAGVFCDGAKPGCALKLSTAAGSAVQSAMLALEGVSVSPVEGIAGQGAEDTIRHLGSISREGTSELNSALLRIMLHKMESRP